MNPLLKRITPGLIFLFLLMGPPNTASVSAADPNDWRQAEPGYHFTFPKDHAAHPDYRIEWWYYTGNLKTADGRRFGYQLTFFRTGVVKQPRIQSRWAVRDLYFAHMHVSDIDGRAYHCFDRISRGSFDEAGASATDYHVWNGDWQASVKDGIHQLQADQGGFGLKLDLAPLKPPVIHGENGVHQKGATPGNASHYYSLTRMNTTGHILLDGEPLEVSGQSWMDHEFSTSFLEKDQLGWDWFSIQFDDNRELMLYRMRRADGREDPFSSGTWIDEQGRATPIRSGEFELIPGKTWKSPTSGARYPIEWTLKIPGRVLELKARAAFPQQEMRTEGSTGMSYWEGSIEVEGMEGGRRIKGRGYLEMTGYAHVSLGQLFEE